jgi:short-subunit dehydrogenase
MKRLLIIGATSAIASETARRFAGPGTQLCLAARNAARLEVVAADLRVRGATVTIVPFDADDLASHGRLIEAARAHLGTIDAVLIAHGVLPEQTADEIRPDAVLASFATNATSVISLLTLLASVFEAQRGGCIAVITSVAGDRGRRSNYIYGAAKGAVALFLQGLRGRLRAAGVSVVTIKPGFVDTPMTASMPKNALYASAATVGAGIHRAMLAGKDVVYVPWYWRSIMLVIKAIPERIFKRLSI